MLGFTPFSTNPISDIQLPKITGTIYAVDDNDTASLLGKVGYPVDFGVISTTDQDDTASITGFVGAAPATGTISATDGNDTANLQGQVGVPTPKRKQKQNKVQSNQVVSEDIPSEITVIDNTIANLVKQQQELLYGVALRQELVRLQTEMAILEAKRLQELDDEEALLLLI